MALDGISRSVLDLRLQKNKLRTGSPAPKCHQQSPAQPLHLRRTSSIEVALGKGEKGKGDQGKGKGKGRGDKTLKGGNTPRGSEKGKGDKDGKGKKNTKKKRQPGKGRSLSESGESESEYSPATVMALRFAVPSTLRKLFPSLPFLEVVF